MKTPITPLVHLGGTSREELRQQYERLEEALRGANEAIQAATPNGRDYYPHGPDALRQAIEEHNQRARWILSAWGEVIEILRAINEEER